MNTQKTTETLNNLNTDNDHFFFIFTPKTVDIECCCYFCLRTAMKLLAVSFLFGATSSFMSAVKSVSPLIIIISVVMSLLSLVIAFYLFIAAVNLNAHYSNVAYVLFEIIILINLIEDLTAMVLLCLGIISPLGNQNVFLVLIIFVIVCLITVGVNLYFLWIVFSFKVHLKNNRLRVVLGEEVIMDHPQAQVKEGEELPMLTIQP